MPNDEAVTRPPARDPSLKPLLRSLLAELAIYTPLVIVYYLLILQVAERYLADLYQQAPLPYAVAAILAIVVQGVLLERLTSWLVRQFGLR
jgi:hypothetical protein